MKVVPFLRGDSMENKVDLFKLMYASHVGPAPIVAYAMVTDNNNGLVGGVPQSSQRRESYVLLSALPKELQDRVRTAIQAIVAGM